MKHFRLVFAVLIVAIFSLGLSRSENAEATSYHAIGQYRLKDFAMIEKDGVFHVYAIHECPSWSTPATCDPTRRGFMHLTSTDLTNWTEVGHILPPDSRSWRSYDVWAPSVVEKDGTYYMVYTVVEKQASNNMRVQRVSVATSTDLYSWTDNHTAPVFDCGQFSWAYWNLSSTDGVGGECRDPYVAWDEAGQQWVMYISARINEMVPPMAFLPHPMIVGVATSPDLETWTDAGHLDNTAGWITESPHVFQHNGVWYLPWTSNTGIRYSTSTSMFGPFTDKGLVPIISPFAFASEELTVNGREYFALITSGPDTLDVTELFWNTTNMFPGPVQYGTAKVQVWSDDTKNGTVDTLEPYIDGVSVRVFTDDGNGKFNPLTGDSLYATLTSGNDPTTMAVEHGIAVSTTLRPGSYWFDLDPAAFTPDGRLYGYTPSTPQLVSVGALTTTALPLPVTLGGITHDLVDVSVSGDTAVLAGYVGAASDVTQHRTGAVQLSAPSAISCAQVNNLSPLTIDQGGTIRWILSNDSGASWKYWDGASWALSAETITTANTLDEIRTHITTFSGGTITWKAIIDAPIGSRPMIGPIAVSCNTAPAAPAVLTPANGIFLPEFKPMFSFSSDDAENDLLIYELQIDTSSQFNSANLQVIRYGLTDAGWGGMEVQGSALFPTLSVASYVPPKNLPNGTIHWRVRAIDLLGSGLFSPYSATRVFQTPEALSMSIPVITPITNQSVAVDWTTNNPSDSNIWYSLDEDFYASSPNDVTNHHVVLNDLVPGATYQYNVWTTDQYGQMAWSDDLSFTVPLNTVTAISGVTVTTTPYTATITWQTNEPSVGKVFFGPFTSYGGSKVDPIVTTNHSVTITGLKPLKTYHFAVQSTGSTTITSADGSFTTSSVAVFGDLSDLKIRTPMSGKLPVLIPQISF